MPTVTEQLRKAVEKSGLTRYRISQITGIDQSRLCRFIAGGKLTMDQADLICKLLGLELKAKKSKGR